VIRGSVTIRSSFKDDAVQVFGINLEDHMKVSDLGSQIVVGSLNDFKIAPNGALIGREMADRLHLQVGDSFQCLTISNPDHPRRYKVSAIYETGVSDIDKLRVYVHTGEARSLFQKPTGVTYLQVDLFDHDTATEDAAQIEQVISYSAKSWQVRERVWLEVFRALSVSTAMTVSIFTLIAGLAMFNTLAMIVMEKTKDIAILRSMGYTRPDITRIFLWQAVIVLLIGSLLGALIGVSVTFGISKVPLNINGIFKTSTFVVSWSIWHYVEAVSLSILMVMVASLIPARRAARLEPGDIIRGTAQ
jgi:lipoprotein-releasing system permease protein